MFTCKFKRKEDGHSAAHVHCAVASAENLGVLTSKLKKAVQNCADLHDVVLTTDVKTTTSRRLVSRPGVGDGTTQPEASYSILAIISGGEPEMLKNLCGTLALVKAEQRSHEKVAALSDKSSDTNSEQAPVRPATAAGGQTPKNVPQTALATPPTQPGRTAQEAGASQRQRCDAQASAANMSAALAAASRENLGYVQPAPGTVLKNKKITTTDRVGESVIIGKKAGIGILSTLPPTASTTTLPAVHVRRNNQPVVVVRNAIFLQVRKSSAEGQPDTFEYKLRQVDRNWCTGQERLVVKYLGAGQISLDYLPADVNLADAGGNKGASTSAAKGKRPAAAAGVGSGGPVHKSAAAGDSSIKRKQGSLQPLNGSSSIMYRVLGKGKR